MISELRTPSYPLDQFIESYFYFNGVTLEHRLERYLPDGNVQLIIDLKEEPQHIYDNTTLREIQTCRRAWFSGFRTEPITIPSGIDSELLIIQFHKGRVAPFLSEPMHALTDAVIDADLVLKNKLINLRDKLRQSPTVDQKFQILEQYLFDHYLSQLSENNFIDYVIRVITANPQQCSLQTISGNVGYSHKHLIKIFKDHIGVSPKEFLKVIRFQKAIREIETQGGINWTALALDCGYYDQSHFIADFKVFSGFTPAQYIKSRGQYLNYIPVLEQR